MCWNSSDSQGVCPCVSADIQAGTWRSRDVGEKPDIFCTPPQGYSLSKGTEMAVHLLLLPAKVWDDEWAAGFTAGQSQLKSLKASSQESSLDFTVYTVQHVSPDFQGEVLLRLWFLFKRMSFCSKQKCPLEFLAIAVVVGGGGNDGGLAWVFLFVISGRSCAAALPCWPYTHRLSHSAHTCKPRRTTW